MNIPCQMRRLVTRSSTKLLLAATCVLGDAAHAQPLAAFPGASGQGAIATGGRGGDIYHVTSLSDYSTIRREATIAGSLRHAIQSATGPRTIVFDVGGAIQLHAPLDIRTSKLTIAGQTAPGGITLWGYPVNVIKSSDVVVRYIRVRTGDFNAQAPSNVKDLEKNATGKGAHDLDASAANAVDVGRSERIILDHVSAAWGMDETLSVTLSRDVTVQHCIVAESLNHSFHPKGPHGFGSLIRGELTPADQRGGVGGYTFFGCSWAFHAARNPSIGGQQHLEKGQSETDRRMTDVNIVNNVVYGWGERPTHRSDLGAVRINLVGNYYINGPAKDDPYIFHEGNAGKTQLFQSGNMLDADQDAMHNGKPVGATGDFSRTFRKFDSADTLLSADTSKPFNFFSAVASHTLLAEEAYQRVVARAGASLVRDAIDRQVIEAVVHRTGSLIDSQDTFRNSAGKLAGIDDVPTITRPADFDTDADGMSDEFEQAHGLDTHDLSDRNGTKLSIDGYTNLEVYLNELAPTD